MTERDEHLLRELSRRNWIILACLVLLSLLWRSLAVTFGVLGGGLVAIAGYLWLGHSLRRIMAGPSSGSVRKFQFGYLVRLAVLAAALFLLIVPAGVNPIALAAGLSVVVINISWTAVKRSF